MLGTLEALLVTQTGIPTIIISSSLYSFIFASFKFCYGFEERRSNQFDIYECFRNSGRGCIIRFPFCRAGCKNCHICCQFTYSLEGMRLALLQGYSIRALLPNIVALILFSIIMLPLSIFIFGYAVKRAKIDGTLTQY